METSLSATKPPNVLVRARERYRVIRQFTIGGSLWRSFDTGGDKGVLILLPGSLGTAEIFCRQATELSDAYRCIAIDYPDLPPVRLAGAFMALLEEMEIGQATVLGASLAGYWLQYVPAFDRIERVVLANTFADSKELALHPLFNIERLKSSSGESVKGEWLARLGLQPSGELRDLQLVLLRDGQEGEVLRKRLLAAACALPSPTMVIEQRRIAIVACDDDPLLYARTRRGLFERYPSASHLYLPRGGHYPHVTQFAKYNQFLRRFMSESAGGFK